MVIFENGIQGLSDSKWAGVKGSAHRLVGIDYRTVPGQIQAHQKMTKHSGTTVTELCKVGLPLSDGSQLWFSSESGKIWREVAGTYSLLDTISHSNGYVNTMTNTGFTYAYNTQVNIPQAHCFSSDGTKLYVLCNAKVSGNNGEIFQYTLATPWNISTATYASKTYVVATFANGMWFKPDGTQFFIVEDNNGASTSVRRYNLGTAWDLATASNPSISYNISAQTARSSGLQFSDDGTKMFVFDWVSDKVYRYNLATAWNITTASYAHQFDFATFKPTISSTMIGGFMHPDGTKLYIWRSSADVWCYEFVLTTAWELTTAVDTNRFFTDTNPADFGVGIGIDADNIMHIVAGHQGGGTPTNETAYQFRLDVAPDTSAVIVLEAEEHSIPDANDELQQYVFFATEKNLYRVLVSDVASFNLKKEIAAKFKYGDDTYHPMKIANERLFIGDRHTICEVNEFGVITLETNFSVREPERITILHNFDVDLLIGTINLDRRARALRWDTESETWYGEDTVYESEIHAFLDEDNYTYAIVGDYGQMYYYDGEKLLLHTRIPGDFGPSKRCKVNRQAVGYFFGVPIFGVSNIEGNPLLQGVYSYGRYSKDYDITLDLSYPVSTNEFSGVEIGVIIVRGMDVYVSRKTGTDVGIEKLDWTLKYNGAYIETMVLNAPADRRYFKTANEFLVDYIEMPASTSITQQYSKNYSSFTTVPPTNVKVNAKLLQIKGTYSVKEIACLQTKYIFNTNGNNSPKVENFHVRFDGEK